MAQVSVLGVWSFFQSSQDSFLVMTSLEGFELILPSNGVGSIWGLVFTRGCYHATFF